MTGGEPFRFQSIQLRYSNAADLGPRPVLERVVVEELAAQQQRNREQSPNLSFGGLEGTLRFASVYTLGQIVETEENGGAGKTG